MAQFERQQVSSLTIDHGPDAKASQDGYRTEQVTDAASTIGASSIALQAGLSSERY